MCAFSLDDVRSTRTPMHPRRAVIKQGSSPQASPQAAGLHSNVNDNVNGSIAIYLLPSSWPRLERSRGATVCGTDHAAPGDSGPEENALDGHGTTLGPRIWRPCHPRTVTTKVKMRVRWTSRPVRELHEGRSPPSHLLFFFPHTVHTMTQEQSGNRSRSSGMAMAFAYLFISC